MGVKSYEGRDVVVRWDSHRCIHAGECNRSEGALFEGGRRPWCDPDLEQADAVAEIIERCPSGALTYERLDGGPAEAPETRATVAVQPRGPLYVRGDITILRGDEETKHTRVALCRCGQSKRKPHCDGSHARVGFSDPGPVGAHPGADLEPGPVTFKCRPNGPYKVMGPVTLHAASGRVAWRGTNTALCRCGQSGRKPFCDGTHRRVGFTDA